MSKQTEKELWQLKEIVRIVSAAEGELWSRGRLHSAAFLLDLGGMGCGYQFRYEPFGLVSDEMDVDADVTPVFFDLHEEQRRSEFGSTFSVFTTGEEFRTEGEEDEAYKDLVCLIKNADPVVVDLTANAAYFARNGVENPWERTENWKPLHAERGRLGMAKELYNRLKALPLPRPLPDI